MTYTDLCPMCGLLREMDLSGFRTVVVNPEGKKQTVLTRVYHCRQCASFARAENVSDTPDNRQDMVLDQDDSWVKELYWEVIQNRVCRKCMDGDGKGNCRLPADEWCPVETFLPQLVSVVGSVTSDTYDAYVVALRNTVCTECEHQLPDGMCRKRHDLECALDRYYPMVIEAIEEIGVLVEPGRSATVRR
jgi:hypothetical protein